MTAQTDIVVCGAGPVGAAAALLLADRGIASSRIVLVDARSREAAARDDRLIAISHGSAVLLSRIDAWTNGIERAATPIGHVHISQRGRFGRTLIDRADLDVPALGYVVRLGDLCAALDDVLERRGLEVLRPRRVLGTGADGDRIAVRLDEGPARSARFVIHAEGGLFEAQAARPIHRDYGQTAVTSVVAVEPAPSPTLARTAFERFTEHGPIALLPARGNDGAAGYALVWCDTPDAADARLALDDAAFLAGLQEAFGDRLGRFVRAAPRRAYPLGLNAHATTARAAGSTTAGPARARAAVEFAIGNAAQTLHPVAGQGLNLGLRDAYGVAQAIALADADRTLDGDALVTRFEASRRLDRSVTMDLTDVMPRVFGRTFAPIAWGRGLTLALLDVATPLRGVFARQMMNGQR